MLSETVLTVEESERTPCEWYGKSLIKHHWHDTVDGYQRCANCKHVRETPKSLGPTVEELVHGRRDFTIKLKYNEIVSPISASFYTQIELEAFIKGVQLAANFLGSPTVQITYPAGWEGSVNLNV